LVVKKLFMEKQKEDSLKLAWLIEMMKDEQLPSVPLPSEKEMRRRSLIAKASYVWGKKCRTQMVNLLRGLFVHQGITTIVKKDLATKERREEAVKGPLSGLELEEAAWILKTLEVHEERLAELGKRMEEERKGDEQIKWFEGVAGVGPLVAL
jgi:hypothetical protein